MSSYRVLNRFPMSSYRVLNGYFSKLCSLGVPTKFPIDAFVMLLIVTTNTHTRIWECSKFDGFIFVKAKSKEPIIPKELSTCIPINRITNRLCKTMRMMQ